MKCRRSPPGRAGDVASRTWRAVLPRVLPNRLYRYEVVGQRPKKFATLNRMAFEAVLHGTKRADHPDSIRRFVDDNVLVGFKTDERRAFELFQGTCRRI